MTNPQHIEGLSDEEIELLRGLPRGQERSPTAEERGVIGLFLGTPRDTINILIATIDRLIDTERERVLAEIDAAIMNYAMGSKPFGAAINCDAAGEWYLSKNDHLHFERSAATPTAAIFAAATPQED